MSKDIFNIEKIIARTVATPLLFKNRYEVTLGTFSDKFYDKVKGKNDNTSFNETNNLSNNKGQVQNNISLMASSVTKPGITLETTDLDLGGHSIALPSKLNKEDINITFYNSGFEYTAFVEYIYGKNGTFNFDDGSYKFWDEIIFDIIIKEYAMDGNLVMTDKYTDCWAKSISSIQLSFDEMGEVETFDVAFGYNKHYLLFNNSKENMADTEKINKQIEWSKKSKYENVTIDNRIWYYDRLNDGQNMERRDRTSDKDQFMENRFNFR